MKDHNDTLQYKFRAWDRKNQMMFYSVQDGITIDGEHHTFGAILKNKSRWEVMQYTGLQSTGAETELYVDDVIRVCSFGNGDEKDAIWIKRIIHKVEFYGGFQFEFEALDENRDHGEALTDNPVGGWVAKYFELELIGNAWENPELLTKFRR